MYPDKVHLDAHETELTRAEHDWGVHFWEQDWRAGDDTHRRCRGVASTGRSLRRGAGRLDRAGVAAGQHLADRPDTTVPPDRGTAGGAAFAPSR